MLLVSGVYLLRGQNPRFPVERTLFSAVNLFSGYAKWVFFLNFFKILFKVERLTAYLLFSCLFSSSLIWLKIVKSVFKWDFCCDGFQLSQFFPTKVFLNLVFPTQFGNFKISWKLRSLFNCCLRFLGADLRFVNEICCNGFHSVLYIATSKVGAVHWLPFNWGSFRLSCLASVKFLH